MYIDDYQRGLLTVLINGMAHVTWLWWLHPCVACFFINNEHMEQKHTHEISQPSRSRSTASQSTDGTYLRFSENSLIPSLPLSSQCTKSEITYYLHCINGFPNSHVMKKFLWKTANYQAIIKIPTLHGHVSQIYYYNETSFIGHPQ